MLIVFRQNRLKIDGKHPSSKGKCSDNTNGNISIEFLHIVQLLKGHVITEESKMNLFDFSTTKICYLSLLLKCNLNDSEVYFFPTRTFQLLLSVSD